MNPWVHFRRNRCCNFNRNQLRNCKTHRSRNYKRNSWKNPWKKSHILMICATIDIQYESNSIHFFELRRLGFLIFVLILKLTNSFQHRYDCASLRISIDFLLRRDATPVLRWYGVKCVVDLSEELYFVPTRAPSFFPCRTNQRFLAPTRKTSFYF